MKFPPKIAKYSEQGFLQVWVQAKGLGSNLPFEEGGETK